MHVPTRTWCARKGSYSDGAWHSAARVLRSSCASANSWIVLIIPIYHVLSSRLLSLARSRTGIVHVLGRLLHLNVRQIHSRRLRLERTQLLQRHNLLGRTLELLCALELLQPGQRRAQTSREQ
jgi:hypothetical protein